MLENEPPGACFSDAFPIAIQIAGNFVLLSPILQLRDLYQILHMTRELGCRGICKHLKRSDGQNFNYSKTSKLVLVQRDASICKVCHTCKSWQYVVALCVSY